LKPATLFLSFLLLCLCIGGLLFQRVDHDEVPRRRLGFLDVVSVDPKSVQIKENVVVERPKTRRFLAYHSSEWEIMWLHNVDEWASQKKICQVLMEDQADYVHTFLRYTCTSFYAPPYSDWCVIDDGYRPLWYNSGNQKEFELSWVNPLPKSAVMAQSGPQPTRPDHRAYPKVFSKFIFQDIETLELSIEYIEPLVSHLRFPLARCVQPSPQEPADQHALTVFRGYILPKPFFEESTKKFYFDAGATEWNGGPGGPSIGWVHNMWHRYGVEKWEQMFVVGTQQAKETFTKTIPGPLKNVVSYEYRPSLAMSPKDHSEMTPFLPLWILRNRPSPNSDSYVLFTMDVDSPQLEEATALFIMEQDANIVDEVLWEHNVRGNYLMSDYFGDRTVDATLRESYQFFLLMRQRGVRAHSWV